MKIAINRDDFYSCEELMNESGANYSDNVICQVPDQWYEENKDKIPRTYLVTESGENLIIEGVNKQQ